MAAEAEAAREAEANIIRSDAEFRATEHLRRAAEVLDASSAGMQLRYLQVRPEVKRTRVQIRCAFPCTGGITIIFRYYLTWGVPPILHLSV